MYNLSCIKYINKYFLYTERTYNTYILLVLYIHYYQYNCYYSGNIEGISASLLQVNSATTASAAATHLSR